ncbi:MAG: alanine--glyoxylate aminotransferase family protein [Acidobacteria bacterium]|nr:alanine--glyoxylate aminotransferase family protein [Acidobacteriota bacterium]
MNAPSGEPVRYFVPGPVYVVEEVRQAMTRPVVAHRSPEFRATWARIGELLPPLFRTAREATIATSSSTMLMEAALGSLTEREVLHATCGAFSERWLAVGRSIGRSSDQLAVPWGEVNDPDLLRAALRRKRYEAVTLTHNETSTGVANPLEALARVVREESDALVLVDAVSSLAAMPLETDGWGLDFVFAGVQKGIAAPPGLVALTLSERAERRARGIARRGFYLDLVRYLEKHREGGPITTPAVSLCWALERQLERIAEEGVERRWARHAALAAATASWAARVGLEFASAEAGRSPTVSCLRVPHGRSAPELVRAVAAKGFTLGGGYAAWKPNTFRIGHMGEVRASDLEDLLSVLEEEIATWSGS